MNIKCRQFIGVVVLTFLAIIQVAVCKADGPYQLVKEIPVNGGGECNFLSMDEIGRRLYVVCTNQIKVVDLGMEQVVGTITNASGVRGFAVAARAGRGFLSDGQESKMNMIELRTYRTLMKVETGKNPASIIFEPSRMEIYVFNQGDNSVSIYEADDGDFMKNIKLTGKPGFAVADPKADRVYCTIEDKNEIDVIDVKTHTVTNHWSIAPSESVSGIACDSMNHRIYFGCTNKMISMMNDVNGQFLGAVPAEQAVNAVGFNPVERLVFGSDSEGVVIVATEYTLGNLKETQTFKTGQKVRALAIDSKTGNIYLATSEKILVYGMRRIP